MPGRTNIDEFRAASPPKGTHFGRIGSPRARGSPPARLSKEAYVLRRLVASAMGARGAPLLQPAERRIDPDRDVAGQLDVVADVAK